MMTFYTAVYRRFFCFLSRFRWPGRLSALTCLITLCTSGWATAQGAGADGRTELQDCVQQQVVRPENRSLSVDELFVLCEQQLSSVGQRSTTDASTDNATGNAIALAADKTSNNGATSDTAPDQDRFFRPYKDNYIVFGQARTADGSSPFSGARLDTKFELGLTFNPFDKITNLTFLAPLGFGYSQRSWWDISEDSEPFAENNYNPEIFWRFDQPQRPLVGNVPFVDIIGVEHQSNGQQGLSSRSWDRAYIQKEFDVLPRLSVGVKLWNVFGDEANNKDITDYLGQGEATFKFNPNDRTQIRLRLTKGNAVEKYSYQFDISYRRPWLNSAFFVSYYDGYGEALISYNQKTRSLRAGLYFPLEVLSR